MTSSSAIPIFREITGKRLVEIYDYGDSRSLYFGGRFLQSRMSLSSPHILKLPYTHYMMFGLLLTKELRRVLLIGLGAGSLVRFLHHYYPECTIDAVDNSAQVIKLAKGYFQLPEDNRVRIYCKDGQHFLNRKRPRAQYDMILVDAFDEDGMSAHIYAEPFFRHCAAAMQPKGILCCNLWSGIPGKIAMVSDDLASYFNSRLLLPVPERGNVVCIASVDPIDWRDICRNRKELRQLQKQFSLDFPKMVRVALQHNTSFGQRLRHFFTL